jgi:hypothetical protein
MRLVTLFPHLAGLRLSAVVVDGDAVQFHLEAARCWATCPLCQRRSRRVHGTYARTMADLPIAGRALTIRLRVRRFRCTNRACPRRIFAERFPALTSVRARRTHAQRAALEQLGFALGGAAGTRLAAPLGLAGSRATILRVVHAAETPPLPAPRVLGVDEWARKRGQTYGTILVDLERRRVVDCAGRLPHPTRSPGTRESSLPAEPRDGVNGQHRAAPLVPLLYGAGSRFLGRHWYQLVYQSQREGEHDRLRRRAQKLAARLGGGPRDEVNFLPRPKGMHWRTYRRLRAEAVAAELAYDRAFWAHLARLVGVPAGDTDRIGDAVDALMG